MTDPAPSARPITYADAGVDIDAGNRTVDLIGPAVAATRRPGADGKIGGFGGLFDLAATGYRDPILVAATDGVGTKLRIAIETGTLHTIGIDLVAMCVNDLIVQGAEPLFFLDYYATGHLDPDSAAAVVTGIADGCRMAGAALIGGETAEMPGLYAGRDFDLAGFAVGAVERDRRLPRPDLQVGDVLLGLASSGVHSNGYSLVRRVVAETGVGWNDPAPFAADTPLGAALLTPTRIYVRPLLEALRSSGGIKAMAHITGGGITENVPRMLGGDLAADIDLSALPVPPVLAWLRNVARLDETEFLRTFNGGIGMAIAVAAEEADAVSATLTAAGETVVRIGHLKARSSGSAVVYSGRLAA